MGRSDSSIRASIQKSRQSLQGMQRFIARYTAGFRGGDVKRLFDRDATRAFEVLTRDRQQPEPEDGFLRFFARLKNLFLGLSFQLTPARRLLFMVSLLAAALGFVAGSEQVVVQFATLRFATLLFFSSILGLLFLLALELVDRIQVRDELEVARELQANILPEGRVELPGLDVSHGYRMANHVGGDYYCFVPLADGRVVLAMGDASGHGIAAGLLMAIAEATLKIALELDPAPEKLVPLFNRSLCRTGGQRAFMSLFYGLLDPDTGELEYVCAGHPYPLLRRRGGEVEELGEGGYPLGIQEELEVPARRASLEAGDLLVLYTDGLPEAVHEPSGEDFGFERLRRLVAEGGSPRQVVERIHETLNDFLRGEALVDDVSLVALTRLPPLPASGAPADGPAEDSTDRSGGGSALYSGG